MIGRVRTFCAPLLLVALVMFCAGSSAAAQDAVWRVSKASGDVSVTTSAGQQAALTDGATVKPGDNIRTGQNGRVLLVRGEETILISPNSVIGIPGEKKSGLSTTIIQQAGSILLEVEKRNLKHFSVETPYLAAVVKGTQFRVTVNKDDSRVEVLQGQVEVSEFKSGKYALVQPGQAALVSLQGSVGLSLSGSGTLSPIQQGAPRSSSIGLPPTATATPMTAPAMALVTSAPPVAPPARMAAVPTQAQPAIAWSPANPPKEGGWTAGLPSWSKGVLGSDRRTNRNEDIAVAVGVSCAVGFAVALVIGAHRRRKSRKLAQMAKG